MYLAAIFDLDGTLIDTESVSLRTGQTALSRLGLSPDAAVFEKLIGLDEHAGDAILAAAWPQAAPGAIRTAWHEDFEAAILEDLPLKPGAHDLLQRLGVPVALCTSSMRDAAHRKLGMAGLSDYFTHVITRDDVTHAKPHPEPYLTAAARLGVEPGQCVVFEDSETGAASARAAGCLVVQIPDIMPSEGRFADHLAPSLLDGARLAGLIA